MLVQKEISSIKKNTVLLDPKTVIFCLRVQYDVISSHLDAIIKASFSQQHVYKEDQKNLANSRNLKLGRGAKQ